MYGDFPIFFLVDITLFLVVVLGLATPIFIGLTKLRFLSGIIASFFSLVFIATLQGALSDYAVDYKLWWLNVDVSKLTYDEQLRTVTPRKYRGYAENLLKSEISGVSWQLSVMLLSITFIPIYTIVMFSISKTLGAGRLSAISRSKPQ